MHGTGFFDGIRKLKKKKKTTSELWEEVAKKGKSSQDYFRLLDEAKAEG